MPEFDIKKIAGDVHKGDIIAASKLIRMAEEEDPGIYAVLKQLYKYTGRAYILGITGLPGSGKSTLVNFLIKHFRDQGKSVGVIAVDPSSPLTSGAILGDGSGCLSTQKTARFL